MSGKASFVAFLALGLIVANALTNGTLSAITSGAKTTKGESWYKTPWGTLGYQGIGLVVAVGVASASDQVATVVVVFLVALWVLWLINFTTKKGAYANG